MTRDAKKAVRQEAIDRLREWIKPGDTVHTQLKSVSRSGMSRVIQVVKLQCREDSKEPDVLYLGYNVAEACEFKYDREREGVKIGGCGMDMGFAIVYNLARVMFRDGFGCIGEGCPSNDHSNGDRDYTPHGKPTSYICGTCDYIGPCFTCPKCVSQNKVAGEAGHWHRDGGYALKQRWL